MTKMYIIYSNNCTYINLLMLTGYVMHQHV